MAKILDNTTINGPVQRIVETNNGYIIQGNYYDKVTLSPRPFKNFINYGNGQDLSFNKSMFCQVAGGIGWSQSKTTNGLVITDSEDPTITYVFSNYFRSSSAQFSMQKIKETDDNVQLIASTGLPSNSLPSAYSYISHYMGQSKDYLFVVGSSFYNAYSGFYRINKVTLGIELIANNNAYTYVMKFRENSNYIYWGFTGDYCTTYMFRYNKLTNVNENMGVPLRQSPQVMYTVMSPELKVDDNTGIVYEFHVDSTSKKFDFYRNTLDYSQSVATSTVKQTAITINWGTTGLTMMPMFQASRQIKYEPFFTTTSSGKTYLNISVSSVGTDVPASNYGQLGIYTFAIDDTTKDLTCTAFVNVTSALYRNFIGLKNNEFLVCHSDTALIYVTFDEANQKFVVTDTNNCTPNYVGIDLSENIWFVNGAWEIEMISPFIPTTVNVNYEKDSYKYEGDNIDTFITIEAKNYNGSNIAATLDLQIKGPGVFTSNNMKTIRDVTLTTGTKNIPVQVNGAGNLVIYPKLVL